MAVEVIEDWSKESDAGDSASRGFTVKGALSATHARVADDGTTRIPRRGDLHPTNPGLWAGLPSATRVGFNLYEVIVSYGQDRGSTTDDTDPLAMPPRYRWSIGLQSVEKDVDIDGNPILNSARDPFEQPPQVTDTQVYLTVTRNVPYFDVARALLYTNTVNQSAVTIPLAGVVNPGQIKCLSIVPAADYTKDSPYVEEVASFELAPYDLASIRILDQGFFGVVQDGGKPVDLGDAPPGGFRLNGLGGVLPNQGTAGGNVLTNVPGFDAAPTGATVEIYPPGAGLPEAVWLRWQMLKKRDFGLLGIFNV